jgi:hypothetical protein
MTDESVVAFERYPGESDFLSIMWKPDSADHRVVALGYPIDEDNIPIPCSFFLTNYRTVILPIRAQPPIFVPHMSLELWDVSKAAMTAQHRAVFTQRDGGQAASSVHVLSLNTKYLWSFRVVFEEEKHVTAARRILDSLRPGHLSQLPAFELFKAKRQNPEKSVPDYGWSIYDCEAEMNRQLCQDPQQQLPSLDDQTKVGIAKDLRHWFRTTTVLQDDNSYGRTPTYPFKLVLPNACTDIFAVNCFYQRSRARIPAVSFVHLGSGGVLCRCSQPLTKRDMKMDGDLCYMFVNSGYGVSSAKPARDPRPSIDVSVAAAAAPPPSFAPPPSLLDSPRAPPPPPSFVDAASSSLAPLQLSSAAVSKRSRTLVVADCRPQAAALGNQTMGGGFESGATHNFCRVKFHGIDNIHGVTKAFSKLKQMIHAFNGKQPREGFYGLLHESSWLYHIQRVLMCAVDTAECLERGESVMVHCTDGWDRTSQVTSLAMMLLDPYFRTLHGFCVLIEKEFCSFGHKFAERCSHQVPGDTFCQVDSGVAASDTETQQQQAQHKLQPSPIFVQWLDCVFQIMRQFPQKFEFTTKILEQLSTDVYSCMYGTFIANNEKERVFEGVKLRTSSVWTSLLEAARAERAGVAQPHFLNPGYMGKDAMTFINKKRNSGIEFIVPCCSSKRIVFWEDFYLKYDSDNFSMMLRGSQETVREELRQDSESAALFEALRERAISHRRQDEASMEELLKRLQVHRTPPPVANNAASQPQVNVDSKVCWKCHEKFGFFQSKEYCAECTVRAPICSRCIQVRDGVKLCRDCFAMNE